jgi:hypothetical protein
MKAFSLVAIVIVLAILPIVAADDTISGKWQIHQNVAGYENDQTCTFTQKGSELTGACQSDQGSVQIAGKVDDKKVTWSFKSEYNGTAFTVNYTGMVEPSKISGTIHIPEFSVDGEFKATQAK